MFVHCNWPIAHKQTLGCHRVVRAILVMKYLTSDVVKGLRHLSGDHAGPDSHRYRTVTTEIPPGAGTQLEVVILFYFLVSFLLGLY